MTTRLNREQFRTIRQARSNRNRRQPTVAHLKSTISTSWLEHSELPRAIKRAVKAVDKAINDYFLRVHLSYWQLISTAPFNQELELRIAEDGEILILHFPCLQTNLGAWINVDLGAEIKIEPAEWRVWQRDKSPHAHHARINASDRPVRLHRGQNIYGYTRTPLSRSEQLVVG
jgi:hypothetical protein